MRSRILFTAGISLASLAHAQTPPVTLVAAEVASADDDAPAATGTGTAGVAASDIVVTARRRTENVQDVPLAISVVSGATLEAQGTYNINRLTSCSRRCNSTAPTRATPSSTSAASARRSA